MSNSNHIGSPRDGWASDGELLNAIQDDIRSMDLIRHDAIKKLNELLRKMDSYHPDEDHFHYLRDKVDGFAYSLGGYVAAENPGERLYFWSESY